MRQSNEKAAADGDAPDLCQGGASVYHKSQPESRSSFISDRVSLALVPETSSRRPLFHSLGRGMPRPVSLTWHHPPARHSPFPELKIVGNPAAYGRLQQNSAQHEQNVTCGCSRGRRSDWGLWLPSRMKIPPYSLKRQSGRKSLAKSKKKFTPWPEPEPMCFGDTWRPWWFEGPRFRLSVPTPPRDVLDFPAGVLS